MDKEALTIILITIAAVAAIVFWHRRKAGSTGKDFPAPDNDPNRDR